MKMVLPESFKSLLWSYDFSKIDPIQDQRTIIVNAINYGDLEHWRWLRQFYGDATIKQTLSAVPLTEIKPRTRKLVSLVFSVADFNYAPRSVN